MADIPKNRIVFAAMAAAVIIGGAVLVFLNLQPNPQANAVVLKVWGTDPKAAFEAAAAQYSATRPNVSIKYSQIDSANYEDVLLKSFAAGQGPDVFMIGNHDIPRLRYLIVPPTAAQITPAALNQIFPAAVMKDVVSGGSIYAVPLYMDTLALIYNRDMLDQAGIATPPATWQDFINAIPLLRKTNAQGQLTTAAASIGGSEDTVPHATDLMSLIMLQNGTTMNTPDGRAAFAETSAGSQGLAAFKFYLDFANPGSNAYTWNEAQTDGTDSFLSSRTAMIFGYHEDLASFKARSPFLNYAASPVPQIGTSTTVNYPSYQGLAVWRQSKVGGWGWDFAIALATNPTVNKAYLAATGRPPALRSEIGNMLNDPSVGIFAKQNLTADSWRISDYGKARSAFSEAVQSSLGHKLDPASALKNAEKQINQSGG